MAPKAKKKDKEDNEVLTRIAIVSSDRCVSFVSSVSDVALPLPALLSCYLLAVHDA